MPIHDFGFKKIEDVEKEVEDGKAQEIKKPESVPLAISNIVLGNTPTIAQSVPKVKKVNRPKVSKPKIEKKPSSHPMVNGLLEIEEEEL